ncbi:MAG: type III secretion system inner membrane ring subunit SctD [Simkaniaceae bacterium]|nr:type III secretion system inner membrane ring subunit SctD [Simkaniaceae bacterium]
MTSFLIVEEGPLSGLVVRFEEGSEWVIGRDPSSVYQVLEDPMVSRKHVMIRLIDDLYVAENLSSVNAAEINGKPITEPTPLHEGDLLRIGGVLLRYSTQDPVNQSLSMEEEEENLSTPTIFEEEGDLDHFRFVGEGPSKWMVKVVSGPNSGAEFAIEKGSSYIIGKDPTTCDIAFHDLSVSRQHAKLYVNHDNLVEVEDLGSRNGTYINGQPLTHPTPLASSDLIALGTTSLLVIDREQSRATIVSAPLPLATEEEKQPKETSPDWKETLILKKHVFIGASFLMLLLIGLGSLVSLFSSKQVVVTHRDENGRVEETLKRFPYVQFNLTENTGKIFLIGHVITEVSHQELLYMIKALPFIRSVEDNVTIDELVWSNFNALLIRNPAWRGVSVTSRYPGNFVLRGYVDTLDVLAALDEFVTINFSYTDHLDNEVVVEKTLSSEIQSLLIEKGFNNVTFQLSGGELLLAGRVSNSSKLSFDTLLTDLRQVKGIRQIKSFVLFSSGDSALIDLTGKYTVTGTSKLGNIPQYVVIDGKILSKGDHVDDMSITLIDNSAIFLEKDGLKFKINYNQP